MVLDSVTTRNNKGSGGTRNQHTLTSRVGCEGDVIQLFIIYCVENRCFVIVR